MKQEQWTNLWKWVNIAAIVMSMLALVFVILTPGEVAVPRDYQCAVYTEQGCAKTVIASGGEFEVQSGGIVDFQDGSTLGFNEALDMQDDVITNIGNAGTDFDAYGGLTTASGISVTASGIIVSAGGISATGASTINGGFTVNGNIILENGEVISNSTDGDVFVNGDLLGFTNIISKGANYTLKVVESGSLFTNIGAAGELTLTLPDAAAGLHYCFYIGPTQAVTIVVGAADMVHHLTNAAGDRLMNGTAGDSVCLTALDDVLWAPTDETGTWNDVN